jgi:putative Ca2+/H+ antiporter (TMEM165/GDT1 family)
MRYVAMVVSVLAMIAGIVLMGGWLPANVPEQYRVILGAVVFLYGAYRFVIVYFRGRGLNRDEDE